MVSATSTRSLESTARRCVEMGSKRKREREGKDEDRRLKSGDFRGARR